MTEKRCPKEGDIARALREEGERIVLLARHIVRSFLPLTMGQGMAHVACEAFVLFFLAEDSSFDADAFRLSCRAKDIVPSPKDASTLGQLGHASMGQAPLARKASVSRKKVTRGKVKGKVAGKIRAK